MKFLKEKKCQLEGQRQLLSVTTSNVFALKTSFLVADYIAKAKKPFTLGEELILPATKTFYREHFGEDEMKKEATIITRRINEIADDVETELLEMMSHRGTQFMRRLY